MPPLSACSRTFLVCHWRVQTSVVPDGTDTHWFKQQANEVPEALLLGYKLEKRDRFSLSPVKQRFIHCTEGKQFSCGIIERFLIGISKVLKAYENWPRDISVVNSVSVYLLCLAYHVYAGLGRK